MKKVYALIIVIVIFLFPLNIYGQKEVSVIKVVNATEEAKDEQTEKEKKILELNGDVRFRAEQDWNSRTFIGTLREDRFRLRVRLRVGFTFNWSKQISIGARIRSGVNESLQSPHNNLGHREFTGFPLNIDKVYLAGNHDHFWWWAGKNSFPFWKQNELFWDDDVTPEGLAIGGKFNASKNVEINPTAAYFITNTGSGNFDPRDPTNGMIDGYMLSGQLELGIKLNNHKITAASSYYALKDINNVPTTDFFYVRDRFKLDYTFIVSGLELELNTKYPITIGFDYFVNLEDYSNIPDSLIHPVFKDQKDGFVASINVGQLKKKGDWLIGYYFARKEEFSVVSFYAEDDWVRFGNINRNRNTNFQGHEIRLAYAFGSRFNVVARAYFVEGLVTPLITTESGNRFRIDLNMKFKKKVR